jgi:two-component system, chemotaxis family, CheB/CheR fusion protein
MWVKSSGPALKGSTTVSFTARPRRVLVVEDDLDSARALAMLVQHMGHDVEYATNGYAALEIARKFKPQVVLLDLGLPGMDGFEVCRRLKSDADLYPARVIVITAYGKDEHRALARGAGCDMHLVKPVSPKTVFEVLES